MAIGRVEFDRESAEKSVKDYEEKRSDFIERMNKAQKELLQHQLDELKAMTDKMSDEKGLNIGDMPRPTFSDFGCFPHCHMEEPKEKRDCYFHHEEYDMGAHIDVCSYYGKLGYCPCENCEKYIQKSEAFNIMKEYVDNRTTED